MFNTVDKIMSGFTKTITKLDALVEKKTRAIARIIDKEYKLGEKRYVATTERRRARIISAKLQKFMDEG